MNYLKRCISWNGEEENLKDFIFVFRFLCIIESISIIKCIFTIKTYKMCVLECVCTVHVHCKLKENIFSPVI